MSYKIKSNIIVLILLILTIPLFATSDSGESAYQFLKLQFVPLSAGLGNITSPLEGYSDAGFTNFSATPFSANRRLFFTYNKLYADINGGLFGYIYPLKSGAKTGGTVKFISYGSMTKTDDTGKVLGEFSAQSISFDGFYAMEILNRMGVHTAVKFIYEGIDDYNSFGVALDFGALYKFSKARGTIGLNARNVGFQLKGFTEEHKDPLPITFLIGGNWNPKGLPLKLYAELEQNLDDPSIYKAGILLDEIEPIILSIGYTHREKIDSDTFKDEEKYNGLSAGIGLNLKDNGLDFHYAYSSYGLLGSTHKFSIGYVLE